MKNLIPNYAEEANGVLYYIGSRDVLEKDEIIKIAESIR